MASLAEVLGSYVQRSHYSAGQVATLSGVPKRSIVNWMSGRVLRPYRWQGLVQIATALKLDEVEANTLLRSAKYAPIAELRQQTEDASLFLAWPQAKKAPFQVIADLPYFVGRIEGIEELHAHLLNGEAVSIFNLKGMGGVGKTTLAAHVAYQLRPYFPDGVLWARLDNTDTMAILANFADAYGADVSQHRTVEGRATAVRSI